MKITHQQGDPRSLVLLDENARFMRHETFQRLVSNIRRDGVLTQWPFIWNDGERRVVLSGNHRVKASIEAGLESIDWTETDERLSHDDRVAIQLSHNAITGEDDPTILKRLYDSIQDVDERLYAGLDDATLELLAQVDTEGLGEANLDFQTISLVFLPSERERAEKALDDARSMLRPDGTWMARSDQYNQVLSAIEDARSAAHVMNTATAFGLLVEIWDRHREDLAEYWVDPEGEPEDPKRWVPITSVFGMNMPAEAAAVVLKAIQKMRDQGDLNHAWQALEFLAAEYLGGQ